MGRFLVTVSQIPRVAITDEHKCEATGIHHFTALKAEAGNLEVSRAALPAGSEGVSPASSPAPGAACAPGRALAVADTDLCLHHHATVYLCFCLFLHRPWQHWMRGPPCSRTISSYYICNDIIFQTKAHAEFPERIRLRGDPSQPRASTPQERQERFLQ